MPDQTNNNHLQDHIRYHGIKGDHKLHVIGVVSNPVRFHSRYRLFRQWVNEMLNTPNVVLHVVEGVHGDRHAECAPLNNEYNYKAFKLRSEIWVKENLINLGVRYLLPKDWQYMAWLDGDISFRNNNWATQTISQLQTYKIVQPWSDAIDLTFNGGVHKHFRSFGYYSAKHIPQCQKSNKNNPYKHPYGHTGFAWACTRSFYEHVEKLLDFAILGSGDAHMAYACLSRVQETINSKMSNGYKHMANVWQHKAGYASGGIVGYVPGRLEHYFHGAKSRRKYAERWQVLVKYKFDPMKDLKYDSHGVLKLKGKVRLEHAIMNYNRERLEDGIENY